jgi:AAA+ ATPase superfamily predicted ATPase
MRINSGGLSSIIIGRETETQTLKMYCKMGQHCAITAPRRYGKTTLVNHVLSELQNDYLIVRVDVFSASSIRELSTILIDSVYASIGISNFFKMAKENVFNIISGFKVTIDDVSIGYDIIKEENEETLVRKAFEFPEVFAKKHGKKMILFFDEFGDINKFGNDILKKLRSAFQLHSDVTYIFAGSQESVMNHIFLKRDNAFFNFCSVLQLGKLPKEAVEVFLQDFEIDSINISHEAIGTITEITDTHPYYLMKLIQEAYILSVLNKSNTITVEIAVSAGDKILESNSTFYQEEWDRINSKKHKGLILKEIFDIAHVSEPAVTAVSSSYRSQLIKELISETVIDKDRNAVDPFFKLWLQRIYQ